MQELTTLKKELEDLKNIKGEATNEISKLKKQFNDYQKNNKKFPFGMIVCLTIVALFLLSVFYPPVQNFFNLDISNASKLFSDDFWNLVIFYLKLCALEAIVIGICDSNTVAEFFVTTIVAIWYMFLAGLFSAGFLMMPAGIVLLHIFRTSDCEKKLNDKQKEYEKILFEINELEQKINEIENTSKKAEVLYKKALDNNDSSLMRQSAELGHQKAIEYIRIKEAETLYQQAIAEENVDKELLKKAADMGNPSACLHYGKILLERNATEILTRTEIEELFQVAATYFSVPAKAGIVEGEFYWLTSRTQYESNDEDGWKAILRRLRQIKANGQVPEHMESVCDIAIQSAVDCINNIAYKEAEHLETARRALERIEEEKRRQQQEKEEWFLMPHIDVSDM